MNLTQELTKIIPHTCPGPLTVTNRQTLGCTCGREEIIKKVVEVCDGYVMRDYKVEDKDENT